MPSQERSSFTSGSCRSLCSPTASTRLSWKASVRLQPEQHRPRHHVGVFPSPADPRFKCSFSIITSFLRPPPHTALSDPAAKENCMMHLLRSLPEPNIMTFLTLLDHLKRYTHSHTHEWSSTGKWMYVLFMSPRQKPADLLLWKSSHLSGMTCYLHQI